jgi:hypothetical protein
VWQMPMHAVDADAVDDNAVDVDGADVNLALTCSSNFLRRFRLASLQCLFSSVLTGLLSSRNSHSFLRSLKNPVCLLHLVSASLSLL